MLVQLQGTLLVQVTAEQLDMLLAMDDGVLAGWDKANDIPDETGTVVDAPLGAALGASLDASQDEAPEPRKVGAVVDDAHGVTLWVGARGDAYDSDNDPHRVKETPRVWLDTASARQWVDLAGDGAVATINSYLIHDSDPADPDCDKRDPDTGFTCTLAAGHEGDTHVAGLGRAVIAHVFTATEA